MRSMGAEPPEGDTHEHERWNRLLSIQSWFLLVDCNGPKMRRQERAVALERSDTPRGGWDGTSCLLLLVEPSQLNTMIESNAPLNR